MRFWRSLGFAHRLWVSYAVLIVVTVSGVGVLSISFFQNRYDSQVRQIQAAAVQTLENEIHEAVVFPVQSVRETLGAAYIHPPETFLGMDDQDSLDPMRLLATYRWLTDLVFQNRSSLRAIHLYYPRSGISVSSRWGVAFGADVHPAQGPAWMAKLLQVGRSDTWGSSTPVPGPGVTSEPLPVVLFSFPAIGGPGEAGLVIAIDLEPTRLAAALQGGGAGECSLAANSAGTEGILQHRDGEFLVTEIPLEGTDWKLVNRTPVAQLGRDSLLILSTVAAICLGAIALALGLARVFSSRFSRPLRALLQRIKAVGPNSAGAGDYGLIRQTLDALVVENQRHLRHEFVLALADGRLGQPDLAERLSLLGLPPLPPRIACLRVFWRFDPDADPRRKVLYPYQFADQWTKLLGGWTLVGALASSAVVVTGALEGRDAELQAWIEAEEARWNCRIQAIWTEEVPTLDQAPAALLGLEKGAEWLYFYPEARFVTLTDFRTGARELPAPFLQPLWDALRAGNGDAAGNFLLGLGDALRRSQAGLGACQQSVTHLEIGTLEALAPRGLLPAEETQLKRIFGEAPHIDALARKLSQFLGPWFRPAALERDRHGQTIHAIRSFVEAHLGDDLSLAVVGQAVGLSEGYLSTLFKESTGSGFVAYVTERRLWAGRALLETSPTTVQATAAQVGFRTPAYFIQQFRRRFGETPAEFRRSQKRSSMKTGLVLH